MPWTELSSNPYYWNTLSTNYEDTSSNWELTGQVWTEL